MWLFLLFWLFILPNFEIIDKEPIRTPICYDVSITKTGKPILLEENELGEIWAVSSGTTSVEFIPIYDEIDRDKCKHEYLR